MSLNIPATRSEPDGFNGDIGWTSELAIPLGLIVLGLLGTTVVPWLGVLILLGGYTWVLWRSIPIAAAAYVVLAPLPFEVLVHAHKIYWSDLMAIFLLVAVLYRLRTTKTEPFQGGVSRHRAPSDASFGRQVLDLFFPKSYRWALIFLLGLSVLSLAVALSHSGTVIKILEYVEFFVVIVGVFRFAGRSPSIWKLYIYALLASASILSLYGFGQFLFGLGPISHQISVYHVRAESVFGQPNPFGGFEADLFPLVAALIALGPKTLPKRWLTAGLVVITLGIISSYSRGAWVSDMGAVVIMLLLVLLTQGKRSFSMVVPYAVGIPVLAFVFIDVIGKVDLKPLYHAVAIGSRPSPHVLGRFIKARPMARTVAAAKVIQRKPATKILAHANPMTKIFSLIGAIIHPHKYYDVQQRFIIWHSALEDFFHHLWLGVGLGNFHLYIQHHRPKDLVGGIPPTATNLYLEWGADLGIGGFIAGVWLEWCWVVTALKAVRTSLKTADPLWYALAVGSFGTIAAFIIQNWVDFLIDHGVVLPFLLALALIGYILSEKSIKPQGS